MTFRTSVPAMALGMVALAAAGAQAVEDQPWPRSVVGTADVRIEDGDNRASSRLVFAAAVQPTALRVELVRAGQVSAVIWCDETVLRVLVPGDPPLLFEGPPSRASLRDALGLPFCPDELIFALRAGRAPEPACGATTRPEIVVRDGHVVALKRAAADDAPAVSVDFSGFAGPRDRSWPRRAVLHASGAEATVNFSLVEERAQPPLAPESRVLAAARTVGAAELARTLGVTPPHASAAER